MYTKYHEKRRYNKTLKFILKKSRKKEQLRIVRRTKKKPEYTDKNGKKWEERGRNMKKWEETRRNRGKTGRNSEQGGGGKKREKTH